MARPDKWTERRQEILDIAINVIEESGIQDFSVTRLAQAMRLTPNAIRYYFPDTESLLRELAARSDERFLRRRQELVAEETTYANKLNVLIEAGLPSGAEDYEWRVIWQAVLAAGFRLDENPEVEGIYHRQSALYETVIAGGAANGEFVLKASATEIAMSLMSLEDYLGYRIVARDHNIDRNLALGLMRSYATMATSTSTLGADLAES